MSAIAIRRAGPADAAALALVAQATFLETFAGEIEGADILAHASNKCGEAYFTAWLAEGGALWLAEIEPGGAPVGYAGLCAPDLPVTIEVSDVELRRIYALSRFHGSGMGPALLAAACAHARAERARRMLLGVKADNNRALSFYRRSGFADIGARRFRVGDNIYDDLVLAKVLD